MMYLRSNCVVFVITFVCSTLAFSADFQPKSFYVIHNGVRSPTVNLREKRSLQETLLPLIRMRRSGGGTGSGSGSGSYSSSSSYAGSGAAGVGGNDAIFFGENFVPDFSKGFEAIAKLAGFPNGFPGGIPGGVPGAGTYNTVGGQSGGGGDCCGGKKGADGSGPDLHARFGGDDGVNYSGSAQGAKGVFSASSSSIDGDGNVKYSVKTGKF